MSVNNGTFNNNGSIAWNCNSLENAKKPDANLKNTARKSTSSGRNCCDICEYEKKLFFLLRDTTPRRELMLADKRSVPECFASASFSCINKCITSQC